DGVGRFNHFENGSIYWTPSTGAHIVAGNIREYWKRQGWERSRYGYPAGEEQRVDDLGVKQEFQNRSIERLVPTDRTLPVYDPNSEESYAFSFVISREQYEMWSPKAIAREVTTHMDERFSFKGCGDRIYVGKVCNLLPFGLDLPNPVRVVAMSDTGFTFKSLEGHLEGKDRFINFEFQRGRAAAPNVIVMTVKAWGPKGNLSRLGAANRSAAMRLWSRLNGSISKALPSIPRTYLTDDNFTVRAKRSAEDENRLDPEIPLFTFEEFSQLLEEDPDALWAKIQGAGSGAADGSAVEPVRVEDRVKDRSVGGEQPPTSDVQYPPSNELPRVTMQETEPGEIPSRTQTLGEEVVIQSGRPLGVDEALDEPTGEVGVAN
ncbi:hypothetical protein C1Y63_12085, partial [Corynebacterium sp. 13CS0277]|uniref:LGFP repeat-containing protein n=1 Tax=Corynebacterium sp. 13CS0277 TaxID=2071994 RepID=UPI000D436AEA